MPRPQTQQHSVLPLLAVVFLAGTALDAATYHYCHFALGGAGAIAAALAAVWHYYHTGHRRPTRANVAAMLRLRRPDLTSRTDQLVTAGLFAAAITVPLLVRSRLGLATFTVDAHTLLLATSAAVIPPLDEELLDRGFIQSTLERAGNSAPTAVLASTIVFGVAHYPVNSSAIPWALGFGLIFGWLTVRTNSVLLPFAVHACWNFMTVLAQLS